MEPYLWAIGLLLAGCIIVGIEMFVPSGGVLAVLAALCFVGAIGVAFLQSARAGVIMLAVTALVLPALLSVLVHLWPKTPLGRAILGHLPEHPDEVLPETESYRGLHDLIGKQGKAACKMLPGGAVVIDRRTYEATSLGMPIEERETIEVVDVRMGRLVVRPVGEGLIPSTRDASSSGTTAEDPLSRPFDSLGLDDPLA